MAPTKREIDRLRSKMRTLSKGIEFVQNFDRWKIRFIAFWEEELYMTLGVMAIEPIRQSDEFAVGMAKLVNSQIHKALDHFANSPRDYSLAIYVYIARSLGLNQDNPEIRKSKFYDRICQRILDFWDKDMAPLVRKKISDPAGVKSKKGREEDVMIFFLDHILGPVDDELAKERICPSTADDWMHDNI